MTRPPSTPKPRITRVRPAGPDHQVVTVHGGSGGYCKRPCGDCPWRKDAVHVFPAEAFRHSASTAYDMAENTFACHQAGTEQPKICAGFLLRGAEHNMTVRLAYMRGEIGEVHHAGLNLHDGYREMAVANGVDPDDEVLRPCR